MSSNTKQFEEKMSGALDHLNRELAAVRAGRANPAVLDHVEVEYYEGDGSYGAAIGAGLGAGIFRNADEAAQNRKPIC